MAPVPVDLSVPDLAFSSLELDSWTSSGELPSHHEIVPLWKRQPPKNNETTMHLARRDTSSALSFIEADPILTARSRPSTTRNPNPGAGSVSPEAFNNKGIQALFALLGASFVIGALWFFFWAKNGGFQWRKGDWDDYKSTVLRRKGPNGTTLSNATKSTRLGGGSVVGQGYSDRDSTAFSDMTSEVLATQEKSRNKKKRNNKNNKNNAKDRKMEEVQQAGWEGGHDNDVRAYRHEKVARVGGLNKNSEALHYGTDYSETEAGVAPRPPRHASNNHSRQASPEKRDRDPYRRDFSAGQGNTFTSTPAQPPRRARYHSPSKDSAKSSRVSSMPGGWSEPMHFDAQSQHTKTYHHPIPGLSGQGRTGGGFRRGRDELDD